MTWYRLVSVLGKHPNKKSSQNFDIDWKIVAKGWHPFVYLPTNLIEFPSAIRRDGNLVSIKFYNPEIFYLISRVIELQQFGELQQVIDETTKLLSNEMETELEITEF